jgi:hypothetical protein
METEIFHEYEFRQDESWIPKGQTFEDARHVIKDAFSKSLYISAIPCLWAEEYKSKYLSENPFADCLNQGQRASSSFLHYRMLVHVCFYGSQTDISKEVEKLWRDETAEMKFYCSRNAEIESCILI